MAFHDIAALETKTLVNTGARGMAAGVNFQVGFNAVGRFTPFDDAVTRP